LAEQTFRELHVVNKHIEGAEPTGALSVVGKLAQTLSGQGMHGDEA
jgi:hypothetical protein